MSNNRSRRLHGRGAALTVSVTLLITTLQGCTAPASTPVRDAVLAGAEIPLLERGAALKGPLPSDGVTPTTIAGRPVELVAGCTEGGEYSTLIEQTRVLIEDHQVDVVIGGTWAGDGLILRELARKYQDTAF